MTLEQNWQPIKTAPNDGAEVLVYWSNGMTGVAYKDSNGWFSMWDDAKCREPSHWMPLPEPPADGEIGGEK